MQQTQLSPKRNLSMECYKFIASFFVVFAHAMFPGTLGSLTECISRCAVHVFFAITGYFNFGANSRTVGRRLKHILKLYVTAVAMYVFWCCLKTELQGGSSVAVLIQMIPDPDEAMRWLILQMDPFVGSLWYINSTIVCYGIFWMYTKFFDGETVDYKPLYIAGFCLFAVNFLNGVVTPVAQSNAVTVYPAARNAWCWGLPMFAFGIFVREYQDRLVTNFRLTAGKLSVIVVGGFLLAFAQQFTIGIPGMPLGIQIAILGLILLVATNPQVPMRTKAARWLVPKFGFYSTVIYIIHAIFVEAYELFWHDPMALRWGAAEGYLYPLVVLTLSVLTAVVAERVLTGLKQITGKKK